VFYERAFVMSLLTPKAKEGRADLGMWGMWWMGWLTDLRDWI